MKPGFLRTSKLGMQHFAHKKGEAPEDWKPESPQHLKAKNEILLACRDSGWFASSEVARGEWIADVLAENGDSKIAFEVQWSPQTFERTKERQDHYKKSGVRGCWFFKNPPREARDWNKNVIALKELPLFQLIECPSSDLYIEFDNTCIPLRDFVKLLLSKQLKFCRGYTSSEVQSIEIVFWETSCWRCGTNQHVFHATGAFGNLISRCNNEMRHSYSKLEFHSSILKEVYKILKSEEGKDLKLGQIKKRYSKTVKSSYLSFGCYECDALFGAHFMREEILFNAYNNPEGTVKFIKPIELTPAINDERSPHWCYSQTGQFCE